MGKQKGALIRSHLWYLEFSRSLACSRYLYYVYFISRDPDSSDNFEREASEPPRCSSTLFLPLGGTCSTNFRSGGVWCVRAEQVHVLRAPIF